MDTRPAKKTKFKGAVRSRTNDTKGKKLHDSSVAVPVMKKNVSKVEGPKKARKTNIETSGRQNSPPEPSSTLDKGKTKAASNVRILPTSFKIVAGSYEKLLYGLEGTLTDDSEGNPGKLSLKPIFIFPAHVSCVKAVGASPDGGKWLATGSTDEIIKIWDLRRRKEVGGLIQHEGSITHLSFPTRSHLISASEDGTICIFRSRDWMLLRSMKGHKGRVNCVAVHPSGKVALSVGKDCTLRMWDLMRGKGSASTKLGKEAELVRWSVKGNRFVIQTGSTIDIYSVNMALLHTLKHPTRVQDIRFINSPSGSNEREYLLVAAEDKKVTFYNTSSEDSTSLPIAAETIAHGNRVKALDTLNIALPHSRLQTTIVSTVSSDGFIRVFDLDMLENDKDKDVRILEPIAEYDTKGSRLTCCVLADGEFPSIETKTKRKLEDFQNSDGNDDATGEEDEAEYESFAGISDDDDDGSGN